MFWPNNQSEARNWLKPRPHCAGALIINLRYLDNIFRSLYFSDYNFLPNFTNFVYFFIKKLSFKVHFLLYIEGVLFTHPVKLKLLVIILKPANTKSNNKTRTYMYQIQMQIFINTHYSIQKIQVTIKVNNMIRNNWTIIKPILGFNSNPTRKKKN